MAPTDQEAPEQVASFKRLFQLEYEHVPVVLYRCQETGLRLVLARVQSPTVHGYFAVQTEAFDDYGCPHTLEHLIFLGSKLYPYKGVLDVLANRCLAQGTNAWTDVDHTCYTVDTAGSEGFLQILPVYLDHVLFPTLKDSGFVTEVHHITGEGSNAGVVYCEMQARENEAGDMVDRALKLAAYPGRCSYKSETGGRMKELRELTNATVREYHKSYYRPDNLCVIVTGQVDYRAFCEAVAPVVASIKASWQTETPSPMERPFSSPVPKPAAPVVETMEFPAEDEKTGAICELAWHGPEWGDFETITALSVMLAYLTQDSISPLRKALVETVPPLCGKISHSMLEQTTYLINITLKSADVAQLSQRKVDAEVDEVLRATIAGVDLLRIRSLIGQKRRQHLSSVEGNPHDLYSGELIGAFLYAKDFAASEASSGDSLKTRMDVPACLDGLLAWPAERWSELCTRWLMGPSSTPRVTIIGLPSKACGERIQAEDASRIAAQKERLGPEGCESAAKAVAEAEQENDVETPDEVACSFSLPDVSKISLIDVTTVNIMDGSISAVRGGEAGAVKGALEKAAASGGLPAPPFQFDHVAGAQFTTCHVMLPIEHLTPRQLSLLPLWCDVAFELPLAESSLGPEMGYEALVQALTDTAVHYGLSVGIGGSRFGVGCAGNHLTAMIKVERDRYVDAVSWISRVLFDTKFDPDRLQVAAKRMLNDVPNVKRNSQSLMRMAMRALSYRDDVAEGAFNAFRCEQFLLSLEDGEELQKVASELTAMRDELKSKPWAAFARVAGDLLSPGAVDPLQPWRQGPWPQPPPASTPARILPALERQLFSADALRPSSGSCMGCLVSSSAEESNYWTIARESFSDPRSPELAPLLVAIEYLTALEGPFWRKIRGRGLSYSYSLSHSLELGAIKFGLFKATDPLAAYQAACTIVQALCQEASAGTVEGESSAKRLRSEDTQPMETEGDAVKPEEDKGAKERAEEEGEDEDEEGLDPTALEAAQSGVLFGLIEPVDTIPSAMGEAFQNTLRGKPQDQLEWLLKEVQAVTQESVQAALRSHVLPLFTGSCGRTVSIVCPAQKVPQLQEGLAKLQPPFKVAHFEVDALVKALAPADGFAGLRAQVLGAAGQ